MATCFCQDEEDVAAVGPPSLFAIGLYSTLSIKEQEGREGAAREIENDVEIFAGIYRQLQDEEPGAGARRLMSRALAEFRASRW